MICSKQKPKKIFFNSLLAGALLAVLGGCNGNDVETICSSDLARFEAEVNHSKRALNIVWNQVRKTRGLASVAKDLAQEAQTLPPLELEQRTDWMLWARRVLNNVQEFSDVLDEDPTLIHVRREVMRVADTLVHFYGHAESGNIPRMATALQDIVERSILIRKELCGVRVGQEDEATKEVRYPTSQKDPA